MSYVKLFTVIFKMAVTKIAGNPLLTLFYAKTSFLARVGEFFAVKVVDSLSPHHFLPFPLSASTSSSRGSQDLTICATLSESSIILSRQNPEQYC